MTLSHVEFLAAERKKALLEKLLFPSISVLNNQFYPNMSSFSWGGGGRQGRGIGRPQKEVKPLGSLTFRPGRYTVGKVHQLLFCNITNFPEGIGELSLP